jgi:hypothetical protein
MMLVTLVGWTMSRSPITPRGSAPRRLKVSRTRASYRAKVRSCGLSSASSWPSRICWARMIEVTAAMADDVPNRVSQILAARSIGSNGSSSGLPTALR